MCALKLETLESDLKGKLILRVGEFHIVLCMLRALGSFVENSGLDSAWIEANLYGPCTTRQILEGKHMKRAVDAHLISLQVLFDLFLEAYNCTHPQLQSEM